MKTLIQIGLIIAIAYLISILVYFTVIDTNSDKMYSKQQIEAIQIEYYTHGFRDAQKDVVRAVKAGKRLLDTSEISPNNGWITVDTITLDDIARDSINKEIAQNRYKYYKIVFTPLNNKNEMAIKAIWDNSMPLSPESMQEILDTEIVTTYPRYSKINMEGSK